MAEPEKLGEVLTRVMLATMPTASGELAFFWTDPLVRQVRAFLRSHLEECEALERWRALCPELGRSVS